MQTVCAAPLGRAGSDAEIVPSWAGEVAGTAAPPHETQGCGTETVENMDHTASQYSLDAIGYRLIAMQYLTIQVATQQINTCM